MKLMALRGIHVQRSGTTFPILEKMLSGTNSPKVKDRALFVLSQARRRRAHIIAAVAKGNSNPTCSSRRSAISLMTGREPPAPRRRLQELARSGGEGAILRSFMVAATCERLLSVAKTETTPELRGKRSSSSRDARRPSSTTCIRPSPLPT